MSDLCFCHLNGYAVKDATARADIETMKTDKVGQEQLATTMEGVDTHFTQVEQQIASTNTRLDYIPDNATELPFDNTGTGLTATTTREAIREVKTIADNMSQGNAQGVAYDNTSSGLSATTVQGAIDELKTGASDEVAKINESLNVDTSELSEDYSLNALLQILAEKYFPNKTYLYNNGNEYEELTGGWTTYTLNGGSVTKNDDCMTLHVDDNSTQRANVFTENYFDLTNYSKLIVTANALTTGLKAIQLVDENGNPTSLKETYGNEAYSPDSPIELDITSYNGRYRIQFYAGAYNGADTLSVYSVEVK